MQGIKYHMDSGQIVSLHTIIGSEDLSEYRSADFEVMMVDEGVEMAKMFVSPDGEIEPRQFTSAVLSSSAADIGGTVTLSNLPIPCYVASSLNNGEPEKIMTGSITITSDKRQSVFLSLVGRYKGDFRIVFDELESARASAKTSVDADAEAARQRVVTPGSGQAMTYLRKAEAARLFLAGVTLTDAQLQRLTDEANRTGATVTEAAQVLVAMADQWEAYDAAIDSMRLDTKKALDEATDCGQIASILASVTWPV